MTTKAFIIQIEKKGSDIKILALDRKSRVLAGEIELTPKGLRLMSIEQVHVYEGARKNGLGSLLVIWALKEALSLKKGISMLIQPHSEGFWSKFYNAYFKTKSMTVINGAALNSRFKAGCTIELSAKHLARHYNPPSPRRDKKLDKVCNKLTKLR